MQYRIHHLMNYKKFRCVLRLSDKDWRIWRLWLTISCLHSSTCESWSPPIYCWRSSSKHCQSSKHSGRVCHGRHFECAIIFKYFRKCIYEDSFGVKILRDLIFLPIEMIELTWYFSSPRIIFKQIFEAHTLQYFLIDWPHSAGETLKWDLWKVCTYTYHLLSPSRAELALSPRKIETIGIGKNKREQSSSLFSTFVPKVWQSLSYGAPLGVLTDSC